MPVVIPLAQCIARPDGPDGEKNYLVDHLLAVAGGWGDAKGDRGAQLRFLAGLLHDAGKTRVKWQEYIKKCGEEPGKHHQGPNHSPLGSALFTYCASSLLNSWDLQKDERKELRSLIMRLSRDIYDHHGNLRNIVREEVPWRYSLEPQHFKECDLPGLLELVLKYFPGCNLSSANVTSWLEDFPDKWERRFFNDFQLFVKRTLDSGNKYRMAASCCLRADTARLIIADRYHASGLGKAFLSKQEAACAQGRLRSFCAERAKETLVDSDSSEKIVGLRQQAQEEAVGSYLRAPEEYFYTLPLPTGMGKTFSSLQVALTACSQGKCKKIIYVAPYISILSQATGEIRKATDLEVLQHHHLSVIEHPELGEQVDYLTLESWQAPVVTTTFNQLFRALFPTRAQHTIRLGGLEGAFVIIDEPQVIDNAVWNLFLHMLETAVLEYGVQVLFTTATLPGLDIGLSRKAYPLSPKGGIEFSPRYVIEVREGEMDQEEVARTVFEEIKHVHNVAVVLNTIRDAVIVYDSLRDLLFHNKDKLPYDLECYNLSGYMTPLHKAQVICEVSKRLKNKQPTVVVCTQILEAGVDLSFRTIFRALSVIPSIAQVAGRANRHGEGGISKVVIFYFRRDGETDTRKSVYTDKIARQVT